MTPTLASVPAVSSALVERVDQGNPSGSDQLSLTPSAHHASEGDGIKKSDVCSCTCGTYLVRFDDAGAEVVDDR